MQEVQAYATARQILPATVVQQATGHSGTTWAKWQAGATCSLRTAEKIRSYMRENPPPSAEVPKAEGGQGVAA